MASISPTVRFGFVAGSVVSHGGRLGGPPFVVDGAILAAECPHVATVGGLPFALCPTTTSGAMPSCMHGSCMAHVLAMHAAMDRGSGNPKTAAAAAATLQQMADAEGNTNAPVFCAQPTR
jgi:hypothetical protein